MFPFGLKCVQTFTKIDICIYDGESDCDAAAEYEPF